MKRSKFVSLVLFFVLLFSVVDIKPAKANWLEMLKYVKIAYEIYQMIPEDVKKDVDKFIEEHPEVLEVLGAFTEPDHRDPTWSLIRYGKIAYDIRKRTSETDPKKEASSSSWWWPFGGEEKKHETEPEKSWYWPF